MKPRVCILITGGTLDAIPSSGGLGVSAKAVQRHHSTLLSILSTALPEIDIRLVPAPFRIDSSQLTPHHFLQLWRAAKEIEKTLEFDGLVIGYGTDTLSFMAPGLATLLGSRGALPVVIVSGMTPWDQKNSDGLKNLIDGVRLAASNKLLGVAVVSSDFVLESTNLRKVSHLAIDPFRQIRLLKGNHHQRLSDVIDASYQRGIPVRQILSQRHKTHFRPPCLPPNDAELSSELRAAIGMIYLYPGLTRNQILGLVSRDVQHVILAAYATGTACVLEGCHSVASAVAALKSRGARVYVTSQQLGAPRPESYSVSGQLVTAGASFIKAYIPETLFGMLMALSLRGVSPAKAERIIMMEDDWMLSHPHLPQYETTSTTVDYGACVPHIISPERLAE